MPEGHCVVSPLRRQVDDPHVNDASAGWRSENGTYPYWRRPVRAVYLNRFATSFSLATYAGQS